MVAQKAVYYTIFLPIRRFFGSLLSMKRTLTIIMLLLSTVGFGQDVAPTVVTIPCAPAMRHKVIATVAVGFIDQYRRNYTLPAGFEKSNTSGGAPFFGRLEYGLTEHVTIAAMAGYDAQQVNELNQRGGA